MCDVEKYILAVSFMLLPSCGNSDHFQGAIQGPEEFVEGMALGVKALVGGAVGKLRLESGSALSQGSLVFCLYSYILKGK